MKRLLLAIILLLIGCTGPVAPPTVTQPIPIDTAVPSPTATMPTPVLPADEYPVPTPTALDDGYPIPTATPVDNGYPLPTPTSPMTDPTPYPVEEQSVIMDAVGAGLYYIDDAGVWRVTADGLTAQITPLPGASTPILSPDGTKLAYMLAGEPAIILFDTLSGQITSLSTGTEDFLCCVFDWAGDLILAGVQGVDEFGPNIGRLFSFTADNTSTPISDGLIGGLPSFHSTGLRIAYSDNGGMKIYDLGSGTSSVEISAITGADGLPIDVQNLNFSTSSWSPSAQHIAWAASFVQNGEFLLAIAILNLEDDSVQLLHPYTAIGTEYLAQRPTWHPSQPLIAFETIDQDETRRGIWLVDYSTGEEQFVLAGRNPRFSPDGAHLAFEHDEGGIQIYTLADGSFTRLPVGRIIDWR